MMTTPRGRPASQDHLICSNAICGFVLNSISSGTPALARRASSLAHDCGKYNRYAIGKLAKSLAIDSETATWQLSCLPNCPQYCRATPTECLPFFGKPVSTTIHAEMAPCASTRGIVHARMRSMTPSSDHSPWPTKCSNDWCCAAVRVGAVNAAMGSTLLRWDGNNKPVQ